MNRIKSIDHVIEQIRGNFGNELDCRVYTDGIFNSVYWPGPYHRAEMGGMTFDYVGVTTDIVKLGRNCTVQDVLDCLERCAQEWRVETAPGDNMRGGWAVSSRHGYEYIGPAKMNGKNHYDEAVLRAHKLNGGARTRRRT